MASEGVGETLAYLREVDHGGHYEIIPARLLTFPRGWTIRHGIAWRWRAGSQSNPHRTEMAPASLARILSQLIEDHAEAVLADIERGEEP